MAKPAWTTLPPDDPYPEVAACYAVYVDGSLVYVGSTTNLKKRLDSHPIEIAHYSTAVHTPWGSSSDVVIKYRASRKFGDWAMVELRLIRRLQPSGNCVGSVKPRIRSQYARA